MAPTKASDSGDRRRRRAGRPLPGAAAPQEEPYPEAEAAAPCAARLADGAEINDLVVEFIRRKDETQAESEAQQAAKCHMSRQRMNHLHTELKVLTVPMLVDWCRGKGLPPGHLLNGMDDYVARGGSIERARKCQTSLR